MPSNQDNDSRLNALGCVLLVLLCALLTRPYVEMGVSDDWSYIRSAQILAQTGHVAYNGWTTAMLSWQLYVGAAFIKLFGFSFTAARASVLVLSLVTTYLLHCVLTGFGLTPRNAALATLTIMLSPVWLMLTVTFMSDVPGLLCIVVCLYGCQRAIKAPTDRASLAWLYIAAVANMAGGSVRQIAWVGVLVLVPSTVWLLRKRKYVLVNGLGLWLAGIACITLSLHWFLRQPYSLPERLIDGPIDAFAIKKLSLGAIDSVLSIALFALPLLAVFPAKLQDIQGKARSFVVAGFSAVLLGWLAVIYFQQRSGPIDRQLLPPWQGTNLTKSGIMSSFEMAGQADIVLGTRLRMVLGLIVLYALLSCLAYVLLVKRESTTLEPEVKSRTSLSWRETRALLVPFAAAYLALLMPRAAFHQVYDRYLVPLLIVVAVFALRYLQEVARRAPLWPSLAVLMAFSGYAVAGTHDLFSMERARLEAANKLTASGVPRTSLEGGFEYDGWTEILARGYVNDPRLQIPKGAYEPTSRLDYQACHSFFYRFVPAINPRYVLSFDPASCYVPASFAPVGYTAWLPPHRRAIYIQQVK